MPNEEPVLQYACCNEDIQSELDALSVSGRKVVSIAAAGERAFGLLLGDPREVIAIDRNPAQVFLGQLKVAALRALDRDQYLAFVGITESAERGATFQSLRAALPDEARAYWDRRPAEINEGIMHVGRCERGLSRIAPVLRVLLAGPIARLRACATVQEQGALAHKLLDSRMVKAVLALVFNPITGRFILRDPVWYGDARRSASGYLHERLLTTLAHHRMDDCFILSLFLHGNLKGSPALPQDLSAENYPIVQQRLSRLRFENADITDFLRAQPNASLDAFSLSDLGGYLTVQQYTELLAEVQRVATPGATVCIREFISQPTKQATWPASLARAPALEKQLDENDRSVGCTFVCATKGSVGARA